MKQSINKAFAALLPGVILVVIFLQLASCGSKSDPAPSAQDALTAKLIANNWTMQKRERGQCGSDFGVQRSDHKIYSQCFHHY